MDVLKDPDSFLVQAPCTKCGKARARGGELYFALPIPGFRLLFPINVLLV